MSYLNSFSPDNNHDLKLGNKIAELVLITGETINISDASQDPRFDVEVRRGCTLQVLSFGNVDGLAANSGLTSDTLSPFLIGRTFLREPSWKYSAMLVGSYLGQLFFANLVGSIQ